MDVTNRTEGIEQLSLTTSWEVWVDRTFVWLPYGTLAAAVMIGQMQTQTGSDRLRTLFLATAAAAWTWFAFTRSGPPTRVPQRRLRIYLVGFLALSTVLVLHQTIFLIYAVTGFFHAALLRPWPLVFLGIGAFAFVVHGHIVLNDPNPETWAIYLGVVTIQTLTTGLGLFAGEKITDIADQRREALQRLEAAMEENAGLHAQLVVQAREAGILDERERLAGEIHDTIAQGLTGVITQLEAVQQSWGDEPEMKRRVDTAAELARDSLADARRSVRAVNTATPKAGRLASALEDVASRWSTLSGVKAEVRTTGRPRRMAPEAEFALLRATQEALANIERHADATRAGITLSFVGDAALLDVRDNGKGFDPTAPRNGESYGLAAMQRRIEQLGGTTEIESAPDEGTAVSIRVPTTLGLQNG